MHSLGINLLFLDTAEISWDTAKAHVQCPEVLQGDWIESLEQELLFTHNLDTTDAERIQGIFESEYCKADLNKIVDKCTHLERAEQKQL